MTSTTSTNMASRVWKAGLGLSLMAAGGFFVWYLWATWQKSRIMDDWQAVPGFVVKSEVEMVQFSEISKPRWEPRLRYRYEFEGEAHIGERIRRQGIRKAAFQEAEAWTRKYPVDEEVEVWVDPDDPTSSVLKKDSKAALYSIWFPGLFVLGGFGILLSAFLPNRKPKD